MPPLTTESLMNQVKPVVKKSKKTGSPSGYSRKSGGGYVRNKSLKKDGKN